MKVYVVELVFDYEGAEIHKVYDRKQKAIDYVVREYKGQIEIIEHYEAASVYELENGNQIVVSEWEVE